MRSFSLQSLLLILSVSAQVQCLCKDSEGSKPQGGFQAMTKLEGVSTPAACCTKCLENEDCSGYSLDTVLQTCTLLDDSNVWALSPAYPDDNLNLVTGVRQSDPTTSTRADSIMTSDKPVSAESTARQTDSKAQLPKAKQEKSGDEKEPDKKKDNQVALIVGLGIVGTATIALVIGITAYRLKKNKKSKDQTDPATSEMGGDSGGSDSSGAPSSTGKSKDQTKSKGSEDKKETSVKGSEPKQSANTNEDPKTSSSGCASSTEGTTGLSQSKAGGGTDAGSQLHAEHLHMVDVLTAPTHDQGMGTTGGTGTATQDAAALSTIKG